MNILFGSEGGTAISVAECIQRRLRKHDVSPIPSVHGMDDIEIEKFSEERIVVFVCSTTGQGEEPRCMRNFWRYLLRKNHPVDMLSNLKFVLFGLGDSSYPLFNSAAKKLRKRLLQLGANEIYPAAFGDDQHYLGYDAALNPWIIEVIPAILNILNADTIYSVGQYCERLLPPLIRIEEGDKSIIISGSSTNAVVENNIRITVEDYEQDIRLISFRSDLEYDAGDILSVFPENSADGIDQLIEILSWTELAGVKFNISIDESADLMHLKRLPPVSTIREILKKYVEPFSCPKSRYFFEMLSHFTDNEMFRDRLLEISQSQDEYVEYCYRPRRTAFEVIKDFSPLNIPPIYVFELFSLMRKREYSISSYSSERGLVEITAGLITYKTSMQHARTGVCSRWFQTLEKGTRVTIEISKGVLSSIDDDRPILCISPGLGVAPMKSLIEKRIINHLFENYLFYGFRYSNKDFLYREKFNTWDSHGQLKLFIAPSRMSERIYVQDRLFQNKALVWRLISSKECVLYLSGNSKKMPDDVKLVLENIAKEEGNMDNEDAKKFIRGIIRQRRFLIETWS